MKRPQRPIIVACVGDSITKGTGASNVNETSYPAVLQKLLGSAFRVYNFGVGGSTVLKESWLPYWDTVAYDESMSIKADIVVAMWGTNDAKRKYWDEKMYQRDYMSILKKYKGSGTYPVTTFVMVSPPLYMKMAMKQLLWDMDPPTVNYKLPTVIPKIAQASNSILVNAFEAMGGVQLRRPELFIDRTKPMEPPNDGCHPNDLGYEVLAETVAASFRKHFQQDFRGVDGATTDNESGRQQKEEEPSVAVSTEEEQGRLEQVADSPGTEPQDERQRLQRR